MMELKTSLERALERSEKEVSKASRDSSLCVCVSGGGGGLEDSRTLFPVTTSALHSKGDIKRIETHTLTHTHTHIQIRS